MRRPSNSLGFTLIEVVIALGLMGIAIIILIELFSGALRLGKTANEYTQATAWARMKLEEVILQPKLQEGLEEGELPEKYRWQLEVKKTEILRERYGDIPVPLELYQIKLKVNWKSGLKERNLVLETYKFLKETGGEEKV
ncbi:MAG: type IV pilus modification PilV family protein [Thermodesulfobacteriota bacterium]